MYKEKGCGFLERVYRECLEIEVPLQEISFKAKPNLPLTCKGESLTQTYIPDFTCGKIIVVELKAVSALCDERRIRAHNYPKASGIKSGVLVNFDHFPKVEYERIVR